MTRWRCAGTAFVTAIVMCSLRIAFLRGANRFPKYRLCGVARAIKCSAVVAALGNLLIVAFQMNARIASDASAFVTGTIAPFEWAGAAWRFASRAVLAALACTVEGQTVRILVTLSWSWSCVYACVSTPSRRGNVDQHLPCRAPLTHSKQQLIDRACAEYGVGIVTWALFAAAYVVELNRYCPRRTWLLRFPVLFIFAGELAKARCLPGSLKWILSA